MLPFIAGETYLIETMARWYVCGVVEEVGQLYVKFHAVDDDNKPRTVQIHNLSDFSTTVATGRFPSGSEICPLPNGLIIPMFCIGPYSLFPFPVPDQSGGRDAA